MLFNSHIFVFVFLPITVTGFLLIRHAGFATAAVLWLLAASSIFYAWWNPAYLWLIFFVSFFPQPIAGPIVRYQEVAPQFDLTAVLGARRRLGEDLALGITIFGIGLFKKVMIADGIAQFASPIFDAAAAGTRLDLVEA